MSVRILKAWFWVDASPQSLQLVTKYFYLIMIKYLPLICELLENRRYLFYSPLISISQRVAATWEVRGKFLCKERRELKLYPGKIYSLS